MENRETAEQLFCGTEAAAEEQAYTAGADETLSGNKKKKTGTVRREDRKNRKEMKKEPWYLLAAFFLPLVLMYLIYIGMEVYPFGKNSVLVLDLNGQYVYYFEYFREIIHGDASLLYAWTRSLGGEFLGIFAYYLCSPFTLIVALLPKTMMTEALELLILIKVGMCGACMASYLKHSRRASSYTAVLFGMMYALCAYGVIQAMNTMWIDAMYLLPVVLYGLEKMMCGGGNPLRYCLPLTILFLTNYYIGFMTCIFLVLYFFCYFFSQDNLTCGKFVKAGLRFALYSVIAAAIASVLLIPAYYGLTFGKTTFQNTDYSFMQRFDFLDFLTKFLPASYDTVRPEGLPIVYSGLLTLLFVPLFMIAPGIRTREKVWSGIMVVLLVMSMNASTVDIFWHGLSKPNWLNYRYSFMLCFFLIMLAAQAFERFEAAAVQRDGSAPAPSGIGRIAYKALLCVAMVLFALILVIQKEDYEYIDDINCIWMSLAFLGGYLICLHPISCGRAKTVGKAFLMVICAGELFAAGLSDLVALDRDVVFSNRQPYADFMARFRPIVEEVLDSDDGFYRMEKTVHRKVNDNMALGIRGISHSTSDLNASVIRFLAEFGYASRSHWSKYLGGTPVADSLLGIKYIIAEEEVSDLYTLYTSTEDLFAYENPYALGILNAVNASLLDYDPEDTTTPFRRLNAFVTEMLGADKTIELFKPISIDDISYSNCDYGFTTGHKKYSPENEDRQASLTYTITAPTTDEIFVYFPSDWAREVDLSLNGEDYGTYFGNETRRIVSLGTYLAGEPLMLQLTLTEDDLYIGTGVDYFYYLDEALFAEIMPQLQAYAVRITDWDNTHLAGTIETDADHSLIYTSIPYDEGWKVTIDGKTAEPVTVGGALLAVDASGFDAGTHTIVMHYMPDCYVYAFFLSMGGIVLLLLCLLIRHLWKRMKLRAETLAAESVAPDAKESSDWTKEGDTACIPLSVLLDEIRDGQKPESDGQISDTARAEQEDRLQEKEKEKEKEKGIFADTEAAESDSSASRTASVPTADSDHDGSNHTDVPPEKQTISPEDAAEILRDLFPEEDQGDGGGETEGQQ